jgi:hypothetical protein
MQKTILKLFLSLVVLIVAQACAPLGTPTFDPNTINTAIAQTFEAALTETAQPGIPITGPSPTPTMTPTQVPSPTPFFTFTPAVVVPQVSVSVATNCRVGPGTGYARVGALLVGETAEVVGRSADERNYWIIRNPDRPGELCWLWGQHATVTGTAGALPVYTPPPLPTPTPTLTPSVTPTSTPNFTASYSGIESCAGTGWWVDIELENTGNITFRSISMTVTNTATDTVLPLLSDDFTNRNGCGETDTRDTLPADTTRIVSSPMFANDPTGNGLRATITLCSNTGQNGTCRTRSIDFTP